MKNVKDMTIKDLFPDGENLGIIHNDIPNRITLVFNAPFHYPERGEKWKENDFLSREIFHHKELEQFMKNCKLKELPKRIYSKYEMETIIDELR